ncbi:MAG: DnaJ domain-containing protein [Firmicutes bacterium]|nr:DnaJ domain-containing protein [Bacillota bacterium]
MNPYEVLGVPENATDEQIKTAYKELVKKYHPDRYQNNPLADLAEDKLAEINEAYDAIMNMRSGGGYGYGGGNSGAYGNGGGYSGGGNSGGYGRADYQQIRRTIDAGNLGAAEDMLNQTSDRSAEWYFLNGVIASRKGWYDEAASNLQAAVNMEPSNFEYRQHLNSLVGRGQQFQNNAMNRGYNRTNDDMCCQALQCYICADCCCDCI